MPSPPEPIPRDAARSRARPPPSTPDHLPALVAAHVRHSRSSAELLREVGRHVENVSRPYPDAWFVLGRKDAAAVEDLVDRVFFTCDRVKKGRRPYLGRMPFRACVEERFDGRSIRYYLFYARLSITRELMSRDYATNIRKDPVLRFQADLHSAIGRFLREEAVAEGEGRDRRWRLADPGGIRSLLPLQALPDALRALRTVDLATLVREALRRSGPLSHVQLTRTLTEVLPPPAAAAVTDGEPPADLPTRTAVRAAVFEAWTRLSEEDRRLLAEVARGASFDEIHARYPEYRDPVVLTRAIRSCNAVFIGHLVREFGDEPRPALTPRALVELTYEVLITCLPALRADLEA